MDFKRFGNKYILRLEKGEEVVETLNKFIEKEDIVLGRVSGIGAVDSAEIGIFLKAKKEYKSREFTGDMEIINLAGNISTMNDQKYLHLHIALCDEDLNMMGGHLNKAVVSVTAEIIIDLIEGKVDRKRDEEIGINLLKFK